MFFASGDYGAVANGEESLAIAISYFANTGDAVEDLVAAMGVPGGLGTGVELDDGDIDIGGDVGTATSDCTDPDLTVAENRAPAHVLANADVGLDNLHGGIVL